MTTEARSTAGYAVLEAGSQAEVAALTGPVLLRGVGQVGPDLAGHRYFWPEPARVSADELLDQLRRAAITGRGGAEFPFWRKLRTALDSGRRRELVVNCSEGEPASAKDSTLLTAVPHLVLDGAQLVAEVLGVNVVHMIVPAARPAVAGSLRRAIAERSSRRRALEFDVRPTQGGFVGGQSRAVVEMLSGRDNLPVTGRQPDAVSGLRGRPTLVSNAETFAQVAALHAMGLERYRRQGTAAEPGTRLLSVAADGPGGVVLEVPHGERLADVLYRCGYTADGPVLLGGYHGSWLSPGQVRQATLSPAGLEPFGARFGAGVILPMLPGDCPVVFTAQIVSYLAARRAQRCGPCLNGLPELAAACERLAGGRPTDDRGMRPVERIRELCRLVTGRGACAHPDGTAHLVLSLLETFPDEVAAHELGTCLS